MLYYFNFLKDVTILALSTLNLNHQINIIYTFEMKMIYFQTRADCLSN